MAKREVKTTLIINILIVVVLVSAVGYFIFSSLMGGEIPKITPLQEAKEMEIQEEAPVEEDEEGFDVREFLQGFLWGSGGGTGSTGSGGGGGGGDGGGGETGDTTPPPEEPPDEDEPSSGTPTATLSLLDFDYGIIDADTAKVTSLTYSLENQNIGITDLELFIYIYDEDDDSSKKGLVRDQIHIGELGYKQSISDTVDVNAYYSGNLATEKILKITLIGHARGKSYNLGSVTQDALFV